MKTAIRLRMDGDVGILEFDLPDTKVNLLTTEVIQELDSRLDEINKRNDLACLILISKKKDVFIAGADIKEIENITDPKDGYAKAKAGQAVLNKLEDLKMPTVAVIDGVALGGGCELILSCLYRISTFNDKVKIGLPEVNLGFVPGFGGTYRLPRVVGLAEGLKMILSGRPVDSLKALKIGLVDRLFPQIGLEDHVKSFVSEIRSGKLKRKKFQRKKFKGSQVFFEEFLLGQWLTFHFAKKNVLQLSKGFYPAPLKAIDVIRQNYYLNRTRGLDVEAKAFSHLGVTEISKNLIHVFYLSEKFRKLRISGTETIKSKPIERCGILGAGVMGGGIAQLTSSRGIWSRLKDINYDALAKGLQAASKIYSQDVKRRKYSKAVAEEKMAHISQGLDYSGFQQADIVIEAVVENMDVKKKVFRELSDVTAENAILASNTSALSVTEMASVVKNPGRVIGFHFFNPVSKMPLVELITSPQTSPETLVTALELVKRLGKTPIVVKDSTGFIVNRILLAYISEAGRILEETGALEDIDEVMTQFGMPMGPFTLSDEVGLDVGSKVMHILEARFGERFTPSPIFEKLLAKGYLGKKSGKGFYVHKDKNLSTNTEAMDLFGEKSLKSLDKELALKRMMGIMINEAAMCLQEKIVDGADSIDVGMIFGTGFPPFRGGLLKYADSLGIDKIVEDLQGLSLELKTSRFEPCAYLINLKNNKQKFYQ